VIKQTEQTRIEDSSSSQIQYSPSLRQVLVVPYLQIVVVDVRTPRVPSETVAALTIVVRAVITHEVVVGTREGRADIVVIHHHVSRPEAKVGIRVGIPSVLLIQLRKIIKARVHLEQETGSSRTPDAATITNQIHLDKSTENRTPSGRIQVLRNVQHRRAAIVALGVYR